MHTIVIFLKLEKLSKELEITKSELKSLRIGTKIKGQQHHEELLALKRAKQDCVKLMHSLSEFVNKNQIQFLMSEHAPSFQWSDETEKIISNII
jgi:hypothetical protein